MSKLIVNYFAFFDKEILIKKVVQFLKWLFFNFEVFTAI